MAAKNLAEIFAVSLAKCLRGEQPIEMVQYAARKRNPDLGQPSLFETSNQPHLDELGPGRWITIHSEKGEHGNHGGHAVYIGDDGKMKTGQFAGKSMAEAFGAPKPKGKRLAKRGAKHEQGQPGLFETESQPTLPGVGPGNFISQDKLRSLGKGEASKSVADIPDRYWGEWPQSKLMRRGGISWLENKLRKGDKVSDSRLKQGIQDIEAEFGADLNANQPSESASQEEVNRDAADRKAARFILDSSKPAEKSPNVDAVGSGKSGLAVDPNELRGSNIRTLSGMPDREINNRRLAASKRRLRLEREAVPLLSDQVAELQPTPEQRIRDMDKLTKARFEGFDKKQKEVWNRTVGELSKLPPDEQKRFMAYWNSGQQPDDPAYFATAFAKFKSGKVKTEAIVDRSDITDPEKRKRVERLDRSLATLQDIHSKAKSDSGKEYASQRIADVQAQISSEVGESKTEESERAAAPAAKPPADTPLAAAEKSADKPESKPGIVEAPKTVDNDKAKPGDQLGLFGEASKPTSTEPPRLKGGEETSGKAQNLFDTHGDKDQMDLFGDGVMPESMVYQPGDKSSDEQATAEKEKAAAVQDFWTKKAGQDDIDKPKPAPKATGKVDRESDKRYQDPYSIGEERRSANGSLTDHDSALMDLQSAHDRVERAKKQKENDLKFVDPGSYDHEKITRRSDEAIADAERAKVRAFNKFTPHADRLAGRNAELESESKKKDEPAAVEPESDSKPNPFRGEAERLHSKADSLDGGSSFDKGMANAFPFGTGRSGNASSRRTSKQAGKRIETTIDNAKKSIELRKKAREAEAKAHLFDNGMINEHGQQTLKSAGMAVERKQNTDRANATIGDYLRDTLKPGDSFHAQGSNNPLTVKRVNKKTITTDSGTTWDINDVIPSENGKPIEVKDFLGRVKQWRDGNSVSQSVGSETLSDAPKHAEPKAEAPKEATAADSKSSRPSGAFSLAHAEHDNEQLRNKDLNAAQLKEWFSHATENNGEHIKGELGKKTVAELKKMGAGGWHAAGMKKSELIDDAYNRILGQYHLGQSYQWDPMSEKSSDALRRVIGSQTDEHVRDYQARAEKSDQEREARREELKKAYESPQSADDWKTKAKLTGGYSKLSSEDREKFDEAIATDRRAKEPKQATEVQQLSGAGKGLGFDLSKNYHSKRGQDIFTASPSDRVDKDSYNEMNSAAKKLGGWYYKKFGSTPGGFHFPSEEARNKFMQLQSGSVDRSEELGAKQAAKATTRAAGLRERATAMHAAAESDHNAERKENTHRRAGMAEHARARAAGQIATASLMHKIADKIDANETSHLAGVSASTHVNELKRQMTLAKHAALRGSDAPQDKWDAPPSAEHIEHAQYPYPSIHPHVLKDIASNLKSEPGFMRFANKAAKLANKDTPTKITDPADIAMFDRVSRKLKRTAQHKYLGERLASEVESYNRLQNMDIKNGHELRAALREFQGLRGDSDTPKADPVREAEKKLRFRKIDGFFPTPKPLVSTMLDHADIQDGHSVLEPSAGKGDIMDSIREMHPGATVSGLEMNRTFGDVLKAKGHSVDFGDFLEHKGNYDRIVMNPPFEKRQDEAHVKHAFSLLKPGGRVVAIVGAGSTGNQRSKDFQDWLQSVGGEVHDNPDGAFKGDDAFRQTGVNSKMIVIDKPDSEKYSAAINAFWVSRMGLSTDGLGERINYAGKDQMAFEWAEDEHPREPAGKSTGGQFTKARGSSPGRSGGKFSANDGKRTDLRVVGTSDKVSKCGRCGRTDLRKTICVERLDSNGEPTGELEYYGSDCVSKVTGRSQKAIESQAVRADYLAGLKSKEKYSATEAQREAGNYKMRKIRIHGLSISIETPKGQRRRPQWPPMPADYGYIRGTMGRDGDHVDVFLGPDHRSELVVVVDQVDQYGKFDEHKCLIGFHSESDAIETYKKAYQKGWKVGPVSCMTIKQFKAWLSDGSQKRKLSSQVSKYSARQDQSELSLVGDLIPFELVRYEWNAAMHPRNPAGAPQGSGGEFTESQQAGNRPGGVLAQKFIDSGYSPNSTRWVQDGHSPNSQKPQAQPSQPTKPRPSVKRELAHLPQIDRSHVLHRSQLGRAMDAKLLDWNARMQDALKPMNVMPATVTNIPADDQEEAGWGKVDKNKVRGLLAEMNQMDRESKAQGIPLSDYVNASGIIPRSLAVRLDGGSRFFDPEQLGSKLRDGHREPAQPQGQPERPQHPGGTSVPADAQPQGQQKAQPQAVPAAPEPAPTGLTKRQENKLDATIKEYVGDSPRAAEHFKSVVLDAWKSVRQEAEMHNEAMRDIMGQFTKKGFGGIASAVSRGADLTKIAAFDEMVDYAEKNHPHIVSHMASESEGGSSEEGLVKSLQKGIQEVPQPYSEEVLDMASGMVGQSFWNALQDPYYQDDADVASSLAESDESEEIPFSIRRDIQAAIIRYWNRREIIQSA